MSSHSADENVDLCGYHAECWNEPEPVGEGHHDVQRSQEEDEVEEEVAVRHPLALVVDHPLAAFALVVGGKILLDWKRRDEDEVTQRPSGNHTETTACHTQTHRVTSSQVFENIPSLTENIDLKY